MSDEIPLPGGWCWAEIRELVEPRVRQTPPTRDAQYIDISSIDRATKRISEPTLVTAETAPTRARQWVRTGDVLVSMTRPNLNAVAMVPRGLEGSVASTGFDVLRAVGVLPEWLFARVRTQEFVADVCDGLQGVVYPAIRPHDVRQHRLPLAPLEEQQRAVEALESYLSRLDDAVASLERIQRNLKRYRAAVLQAAVEGRLVPTEAELARTEGRSFEPASELLARILTERRRRWEDSELAKFRAKGKDPKDDAWKKKYVEPAPPDASAACVPEGWCVVSPRQLFDWSSGEFLPKKAQRDGRFPVYGGNGVAGCHDAALVPSPTIAIGRVGAQCGNVHLTSGPAWVTDNAIYAVDPSHLLNLHWCQLVLSHENLNANSAGTGQPYVNQTHLNGIALSMPPEAEQLRIVAELGRLLSVADDIDHNVESELTRCHRLRQSILKWAFEGKLVDQDPRDEPASVLLERIRAERSLSTAPQRRTRRLPRAKK